MCNSCQYTEHTKAEDNLYDCENVDACTMHTYSDEIEIKREIVTPSLSHYHRTYQMQAKISI